jgi:hypothetical protein
MGCCSGTQTAPMTERHRMKVHYAGGRPIVVTGPFSKSQYRFSGMERDQLVDPRDAVMIVKNPLFRIVEVEELI